MAGFLLPLALGTAGAPFALKEWRELSDEMFEGSDFSGQKELLREIGTMSGKSKMIDALGLGREEAVEGMLASSLRQAGMPSMGGLDSRSPLRGMMDQQEVAGLLAEAQNVRRSQVGQSQDFGSALGDVAVRLGLTGRM